MAKISICIPYHDTPLTAMYLSRLLLSIGEQTFTDYEIILTKEGPFAKNHNAAILKATGEYVQMLQMDDYFAHPDALKNIVEGLEGKIWQITGSIHNVHGELVSPHTPLWTDDIYTGNNRLGSVSTLSFRREKALLFEEPLTWIVDCHLYYRLYKEYGLPHILETCNVVITERPDRLTHTLSDELKKTEVDYMIKLFGK